MSSLVGALLKDGRLEDLKRVTRDREYRDKLLQEYGARDGYAYRSEVSGALKGLGFAEEEFGKICSTLSG